MLFQRRAMYTELDLYCYQYHLFDISVGRPLVSRVGRDRDRMVIGFTTTCAISTPISSNNKTEHHDIVDEILLKVALNTIITIPLVSSSHCFGFDMIYRSMTLSYCS